MNRVPGKLLPCNSLPSRAPSLTGRLGRERQSEARWFTASRMPATGTGKPVSFRGVLARLDDRRVHTEPSIGSPTSAEATIDEAR